VVSRVLRQRRTLRRHERWTRAELQEHPRTQLALLRRFTYERSPSYRRFHQGLTEAPLEQLPVLTKALLMDNFDQISTHHAVRLAGLEKYLENPRGNELFTGRFSVAAPSGSSGRKSIIPNDRTEWATIIASYARANEWAGIWPGLAHRKHGHGQLDHHLAPVLTGRRIGPQSLRRQRAPRRRQPPVGGRVPA